MAKSIPFDRIVDKIVGLGVPGLVLLITIKIVGFAGAAAITTALASLGGPFGMIGGIAALSIIGLVVRGISKFGFWRIMRAVVDGLIEKGRSEEDIIKEIESYRFISKTMKLKLVDYIKEAFKERDTGGADGPAQDGPAEKTGQDSGGDEGEESTQDDSKGDGEQDPEESESEEA